MMHTDLFFETPKNESTKTEAAAAKELGIPVEAMTFIMEVWEKNVYTALARKGMTQ